jgi:predicted aconitase with swiveling domain
MNKKFVYQVGNNKKGFFKFEICFDFADDTFLKKREVTVDQAMVYIYRQVSFYGRFMFLKNITDVEHKINVQNLVFPGVRGLTASSYIVYDYTTSGHVDL